jgi:hypothetical protein
MAATRTPAVCPVSTTSWRYGLRRTCRLVTRRSHRPRSTWPNQARLAFLAVTHRYKRTNCLWLEPFQIADYLRASAFGRRLHVKHGSPCSGAAVIAEALRECGCPHCAAGVVIAELASQSARAASSGDGCRRRDCSLIVPPVAGTAASRWGPMGAVTGGLDGFRERSSCGGFGGGHSHFRVIRHSPARLDMSCARALRVTVR